MKSTTRRHIAILLFAIIGYFQVGNTLFVHTHRLFDGRTVAHSHPFLPASHHSHGDEAIQSIADLLTSVLGVELEETTVPIRQHTSVKLDSGTDCKDYSSCFFTGHLRAPPYQVI